jgi:hypothetical protein
MEYIIMSKAVPEIDIGKKALAQNGETCGEKYCYQDTNPVHRLNASLLVLSS